MGITIDDIEAVRRRLAELPRNQPREVSKQEAVTLLATELSAARRRGYSPEELAQLLSEQGVMINAATLRGYLRRNRRNRKGDKSRGATAAPKAASTTVPALRDSTPGAPAALPTANARSVPTSPQEPSTLPAKDVLEGRGSKEAAGGKR